MADNAPTPTLNDTAPQINLMQQWFHYRSPSAQATQTETSGPAGTVTTETGQLLPAQSFDISGAVPVIFSLVFIVWAIYTFVVIYHWFRYRHKSWFAVPLIAVHLFISGSIIIFMISGLK
jgi:hypothetical protein